MTPSQLAVTAAGAGTIGWIYWYFFRAAGPAVAAETGDGEQRVSIAVKGGYSPAIVTVRAGRPVRLDFFRDEENSCTEEVVFPDFQIRTYLPAHEVTPVRFTPETPGRYEFTCGMGMVRGRLIVEAEPA